MQKTVLYLMVAATLSTAAVTTFTGCRSTGNSRSTGQYIDDKSLAEHVRLGLQNAVGDKFDNVQVSAYRGTVQLSGFVNSQQEKSQAEDIARNAGASRISNQITVQGQNQNQ